MGSTSIVIKINIYNTNTNLFSVDTSHQALVYRAADWKLDTPDWSGCMRITARGPVPFVKLEDKVSGGTSL